MGIRINKGTLVTSNYSESVTECIHAKLKEIIETATSQLSEEYKRDIEVSFYLDIK